MNLYNYILQSIKKWYYGTFHSPNPIIVFTPENLNEFNFGVHVIKDPANVFKRTGYSCTVTYKLVWQIAGNGGINKYGLCNSLTDGWTHWIGDKQELCDYLNDNPNGHTYRIITPTELKYMINSKPNSKQLARIVK